MKKAAFLDRDGVINVDHGYVYRPADIEFVEGIFDLAKLLIAHDYLLIIITNQSGIARGYYSETDFLSLMSWMKSQFSEHGVPLSASYHCPHHPNYGPIATRQCDCRKPKPGLLHRAIAEHAIDPAASLLIGDKASDMEAGEAAGVGWLIQVPSNNLQPAFSALQQRLQTKH